MRLHHLRVQALQAFAATAEVDFDALSEAGLFLLHGETGAGKTTLLDAVVLALFGKLPGTRGGDARERADLAAPDLPTEVVLELTLRGERLRITRSPKQERPKQRGTGTTTSAATVLLERIAPDGSATAIATRVEEVQHELDRLLGMNRDQFCQVVLLPQGQFATFLHAKSDEREELLARLFGTERFEDAERWLTERRKQADDQLRATTQTLRDAASRLSEVLATEPPAGWESDPATLTSWADEAQVLADAERAAADGVCAETAAARAGADAALAAVHELVRRRARHADATRELAAFEAGTATRDADAARLERARAAAVVTPYLARAQATRQAVAEATALAERACAEAVADVEEDRSPGALRSAGAAARTRAGEAGALELVERRVEARAGELTVARATVGRLDTELSALDAWLASAATRLVALERAAEDGRLAVARLEDHTLSARAAAERVAAARRRDAAAAQLERDLAFLSAAKDVEQTEVAEWLDLRTRRLDGMAAELAATLEDDVPCPVCGAEEHPEPAAHLIGGRVTAEQEDAAKARADAARAAWQAADAARSRTQAELAAATATAGTDKLTDLTALAAQAAALAGTTERTAAGAPAAQVALVAFVQERRASEARRATAAEERSGLVARSAELDAAQAGDRQQLAQALEGARTVAERVTALDARARAYDAAAAAVEQAAAATAVAGDAVARAVDEAHAAGFADVAIAAAARLDAAAQAAIGAGIRAHDDGLAERRALVADPDLTAAVAVPEPDEDAAKATAREAAAADAAAGHALERVRSTAEKLLALRRELGRRLDAHGPAAAEAATIRGLATLVDGTSSQNRKRMRLRAYVLAARLEEIADAASERLTTMTDGRYTLALDDERASNNRRSGLGLRVIDGWTGRDRHPASLSGGETFMASLALALGLADVVAAESGGARLETLFVDEGFGSLDERALDKALEVLDRLRDGGRAVGVVSHVGELRQRITAQLHVVKEREGSRVVQRV